MENLKDYPSQSFKGPVSFVTVHKGEKLWKLTSSPLIGERGGISPWWLPFKPNGAMKMFNAKALGFEEIEMRSQNIGCELKEYIRAWCNVCYDWNGLGRMLVVETTKDIPAVYGRFSSQPIISPEGVTKLKKFVSLDDAKSQFPGDKKSEIIKVFNLRGPMSLLKQTVVDNIANASSKTRFIAGSNAVCQLWIPNLKADMIKEVLNVR